MSKIHQSQFCLRLMTNIKVKMLIRFICTDFSLSCKDSERMSSRLLSTIKPWSLTLSWPCLAFCVEMTHNWHLLCVLWLPLACYWREVQSFSSRREPPRTDSNNSFKMSRHVFVWRSYVHLVTAHQAILLSWTSNITFKCALIWPLTHNTALGDTSSHFSYRWCVLQTAQLWCSLTWIYKRLHRSNMIKLRQFMNYREIVPCRLHQCWHIFLKAFTPHFIFEYLIVLHYQSIKAFDSS